MTSIAQPRSELHRTQTILLLRWLLIVATSYLVLFSRPLSSTPPDVVLFIVVYLGSNVVLTVLRSHYRAPRGFTAVVVLFDVVAVSIGVALTANSAGDFFPVYFLVLFLGALTQRLALVVSAAVLISAIHLSTLSQFVGFDRLLAGGYSLRIPFLLVVGLFFGYLVESARNRERIDRIRGRKRQRSEFLSAVMHDLKNPLGTVQSLVGLLLEGDAGALNQEQGDLVRRIHVNVRRVIQLAVNLLDAARIDAGHLVLQRRPTNLVEVVEDALGLVRSAAEIKGLTLRFAPPADLPRIEVDPLQIERVVSNLLDNAIKYTPSGGTVSISLSAAPASAAVDVTDTGPGIPPAELQGLFDKYSRRSESSQIEGSGLGLFIVKAIVQAHGGTVEAHSAVGKGTRMRVELPLSPVAPAFDESSASIARWSWRSLFTRATAAR